MISPRWIKVLRDLWGNRKRAILAVLSIAVGVFAVGAVAHMYLIVSKDIAASYAKVSPADITVGSSTVDDNMIASLKHVPGVKDVQGSYATLLRFKLKGTEEWFPIQIYAFPDYNDLRINIIKPEKVYDADPAAWPNPGVWPPRDKQILLERSALLNPTIGLAGARQGDTLILELPGGRQREVPIEGLVYDFGRAPSTFQGIANGFVTLETMDWLGEPRGYNNIDLLVNVQPYDEEHITGVGKLVREKLEHSGYFVGGVSIHRPGEHPLASLFSALSLILMALGIVALPLSGFLVINIITALITQQVRQIGVMKAVGATSRQVTGMYVIMVAIFGLLSLLVAMPCGMLAAWQFVGFLAYFLNFTPASFSIPVEVILLEVAVGLLVPVIAAFYPIVMGTRVTVREAISNYGLSQVERKGWIDRLMARIRGLPRPLALSLRNTFRRRVRLFLTLATLTLACAIFISILSVGTSLNSTLDEILRFYGFDMQILLSQSYRMDRILSETSQVPGVVAVEGWGQVAAYQVLNDGTQGQLFYVLAPPADSQVLRPVMAEGRWLQPDDENALVVTPGFIQAHPEAQVGGELVLKINEQKSTWKIVGSAKMMGSNLYANYAYMARLTNDAGAAQILVVSTEKHDSASQAAVAKALSDRLNSAGLKVQTTITMENQRQQNIVFFNILTTLLMAMAALLALVGGLGLMGMMSINVLERTREIGVMRAIGATSKTILQIFLTEGILIGWISAALGIILSLPLSQLISYSIGVTLMQTPLAFTFSVNGVLIWLILVTLLAATATYLPAKDAARLTVRDVLAYE